MSEVGEQRERVLLRRAVLEREDGEASDGRVRILVGERVQRPAHGVHDAGVCPREELEREERRAARRRALVLQAAAEQLRLLVEAKLSDGAIRERPLAVVAAPGRGLELVVDRTAQVGEGALVRQLGGTPDGLCEVRTHFGMTRRRRRPASFRKGFLELVSE